MGYKDQKVIRDTRDAGAAAMIGAVGNQFKTSIKDASERKKARETKAREDKIKAQQSVAGRYDQQAKYQRTGNKGLDEQVLALIETAAIEEADLYTQAFGSDGNPDLAADYQKQVALNTANLNDLTAFIGSFDKDVDAAAAALANGEELLPGADDFGFELAVQSGAFPVEITTDPITGRYSIGPYATSPGYTDPTGGYVDFKDKSIDLGEYHNNLKANGTNFKTINKDYNLVMDAWSKSLIEQGDDKYRSGRTVVGSAPLSTGGKSKGVGISGNVEDANLYKTDIINALMLGNKDAGKSGELSELVEGGPKLSNEQIFYQLNKNPIGGTEYETFKEFQANGDFKDLYGAFADQVIDNGFYSRGGAKNLKYTNVPLTKSGLPEIK